MMVVPRSRRMFKCGTCRPCPECGRCSGCSQCCTRSECPESGSRFPSCCNSCRKCCFELNTLMQISIPSIIWVVILLLDGDYVACYQAPSVNRTHGHQKCEQFCNLETSPSLRYYCFRSRIIGSIILGVSVFLLVLLKFFPRWTYCDYTEEGYYKFKYLQSLEKKKWKKIKKELGNMVAKTANVEAKELISNLSHYITDQGEQNPNHGAHSSNEGAQSSSQGDPNSSQDDQELQALITPASDSSA
ncbi:uncharacterized protein LOC132393830 isoform X1 [Hypanus sabinus]|uniref:uncharacterized protein LOC132393830 isoform X1 n=1 Tax=Hypanus sabinus TaxID=79690 RepID=UPI0028C481FB|nr:uncharacterized protein LOC132393830 isoform X1 [Hypanus sabinus]